MDRTEYAKQLTVSFCTFFLAVIIHKLSQIVNSGFSVSYIDKVNMATDILSVCCLIFGLHQLLSAVDQRLEEVGQTKFSGLLLLVPAVNILFIIYLGYIDSRNGSRSNSMEVETPISLPLKFSLILVLCTFGINVMAKLKPEPKAPLFSSNHTEK